MLAAACDALAALPGTAVVASSRIYETAPQGGVPQSDFLNQVVCVETALEPHDLLTQCQRIENEHGRVRELRFGPRTLDIDILLYQDVELEEPELMLPHPRMLGRAFVLVPLAEVWDYARGMPEFDVARLGESAARDQLVRPYRAAEA
jgi:2-amino-4-hydroxy-6-hydroxymethyldihydropteridine diphosphokinase